MIRIAQLLDRQKFGVFAYLYKPLILSPHPPEVLQMLRPT